jgi:hypothetical protein
MTALSTSATSGTEMFERIIGAASAQTRRWVLRSRQSLSSVDMQAPWWAGSVRPITPFVGANLLAKAAHQTYLVRPFANKLAPTGEQGACEKSYDVYRLWSEGQTLKAAVCFPAYSFISSPLPPMSDPCSAKDCS